MTTDLRVLFLACVAAATSTAASAQVSGQAHSSLASLDAVVEQRLADALIPGVTVAASKGGRLVFNKAFGVRDRWTGQPMTTRTRCRIGSTSKMLGAIAIMKLVEAGQLSTKAWVYGPAGVLPEPYFQWAIHYGPMFEPAAMAMRVDHLLSHTSGLRGGGDVEGSAARFSVPAEQLVYDQVHLDYLWTHDLGSHPGIVRSYANHNAGVCSMIIERRSGQSYVGYVRQHICEPLGMTETWPGGTAPGGIDASPHRYTTHFGPVVWHDRPWPYPVQYPSGGWVSTARDLVRLMCATDQIANQSDILSPPILALMESLPYPQATSVGAHGWMREAGGKLWHNGSVGGGASYIAKFPPGYVSANGTNLSDVSVAICANIQNAGALKGIVDKVALAVGAASIPLHYDLFASIGG